MAYPAQPPRDAYARERLRREAERRWRRLGEVFPDLAERIAFARGLVALYIDDLPPPAPVNLTVEQARAKLVAGRPLLDGEDFDVDTIGLRQLFYRLCAWAGRQPALAEGGARLERTLLDGALPIEAMFDAALARDDPALDAVAARVGVPDALVRTLAGYLVVAALLSTARALAPLLAAADARWERTTCPVCGGPPLLAELLGDRRDRWLRCAGCGTGWPFPGDRCIHCGTTEAGHREVLSVGEQAMPNRLEACGRCRGTLKLATVPAPTPAELLTIVDTAFVALEEAASERGYGPATAR